MRFLQGFKGIKRKRWLQVTMVLFALTAIGAAFMPQIAARAGETRQDGGGETIDLCAGQCYQTTVDFEIGDLAINKIDVMFLLDVTGSMRDERDAIVENSIEIMAGLQDLVPDSAFGVATFADYNEFYDEVYDGDGPYGSGDDYPYRLDQNITTDTGDVVQALEQVEIVYGNDTPEANSRAVWEMQFVNWRANAKRIVIIFSDAYPHDPTGFFSENYGVDPGRDEIGGTGDDLIFTDVVAQAAEAGIAFVTVNSYDAGDAVLFAEYLASETGGQYFELDEAESIPAVIGELIAAEISTFDNVTLRIDEGFENWIVSSPDQFTDVGSNFSGSFDVEICPIEGAARSGTHTFDLIVDGDGTIINTIPITVNYSGRCEGGVDLFMPDHPGDDGSVCSNLDGEPFWEGDRIIIRHEADDFYYHENPEYGQTNYVYAEIQNLGDMDVSGATVTLYWANPALGLFYPESWNRIGSTTVDVAADGATWTEPLAWDPPGLGHFCLLARVEHPSDPITREGDVPCDNNIAQRNVNILDLDTESGEEIGEDEVVFVIVGPPEDQSGIIDIVVEHPDAPADAEIRIIMPSGLFDRWLERSGIVEGGYIDGDEIVVDPDAPETIIRDVPLEPGEQQEISMRVKAGNTETFSLTVKERVDGVDIGGNVYYYVPPDLRPEPPSPNIFEAAMEQLEQIPGWALIACTCAALLVAAVAVVVVVIVLMRRRKAAAPPPA